MKHHAGVVGVCAARIGKIGFKRPAPEPVRSVAEAEERTRNAELAQAVSALLVRNTQVLLGEVLVVADKLYVVRLAALLSPSESAARATERK